MRARPLLFALLLLGGALPAAGADDAQLARGLQAVQRMAGCFLFEIALAKPVFTVVERQTNDKAVMTVPDPSGQGSTTVPVPADLRTAPVLTDEQVRGTIAELQAEILEASGELEVLRNRSVPVLIAGSADIAEPGGIGSQRVRFLR